MIDVPSSGRTPDSPGPGGLDRPPGKARRENHMSGGDWTQTDITRREGVLAWLQRLLRRCASTHEADFGFRK